MKTAGKNRKQNKIHKMKNKDDFRRVVENLGDAVFIVSGEGKFIYVNKRAARITGYSKKKLLGKNMKFLLSGIELKKVSSFLRRRMTGKRTERVYRTNFKRKDGKIVYIEIFADLIRWHGKPASFAVVRDITKRKKLEDDFEKEEVKLKILINNIPCIIWFKDRWLKYMEVSNEYLKSAKLDSKKNIKGKKAEDIWPSDLARIYKKEDLGILKSGKVQKGIEIFDEHQKGETKRMFYESIKGPIKNKKGKVVGIFGINHDITDFKLSEKALREKKQEYQELVENINDVIFHLDTKGKIIYASPAVRKFIGYDFKEIKNFHFDNFVLPIDLPKVRKAFKDALRDLPSGPYDLRVICKNKKIKNGRVLFGKSLKHENRIKGVIGVITDVTERRKMERALAESEEKLTEIVGDLPMFICRFNPNGEIIFVNDYCKRFYKEEISRAKNNFFDFWKNKEKVFDRRILSLLKFKNPFLSFECRHENKYEEWTVRAIFNRNKKIKAYQAVGKDITEKKESESKLVESYEYLGYINRQISIFLNLNNALKWKKREEIIEDILSATLEISNAEYVALYKKEEKRECFSLVSVVSKRGVDGDQKSKISTLTLKSGKLKRLMFKKNNQIFKCPREFNVNVFQKIRKEMKYCSVLPLIGKNKIKGFLILGTKKEKNLTANEENFYKVFSMHASLLLINIGKF